jgi:hypothetical protein
MKRFAFWLLAGLSALRAGELWIPQSEIPSALKTHPRAVLLTREQYEALVRDARPPAATEAEAPPAPVVLRSLRMTARAADAIVIAEAEMRVDVLSAEPAALPLRFSPATLASLTLDENSTLAAPEKAGGEPAALLPPGRHTLKAVLHYPVSVSAAGHTIAVCGTPAGASSFSLTLPAAERIESALTWTTKTAEGMATHSFQLPPSDQPQAITWSRRDIRDLAGTAVMQSCDYTYSLDTVKLHADLGMTFTARLAALPASYTLPLPAEARVLSVEGEDVLRWEQAGAAVTVTLTSQANRHTTGLRVELEIPLAAAENGKARSLALPFPQAAGVHRASGRFAIHTDGDLRVRRVTAPLLAVQSEPETRTASLAGQWVFAAITGAPAVEVEDIDAEFHATQDTQVSLQRDAVHLLRHLKLVPRQGRLFEVSLAIPAGEEILRLVHADGSAADWRRVPATRETTLVEVRFPAGLKPGTDAALQLATRLDPPEWNALPEAGTDIAIARVSVTGADKLSGFIAVAAEDRFAVSTTNVPGLESRDPASLGDDVPVRGGFVWFAPGDFRLPLHVTPRAAEFDARVAAYALPLRHGVEIEGSLMLDIQHSALRTLTVQLAPAVAPLWRCDSPAISGMTLDKATGEWRITFRDEIRGASALRWHLLLPVTEAPEGSSYSAAIPVLRMPGARRTDFHWVLEANTDTELSFDTSGLDARDTLTLPVVSGYTPRHRVIAAWSARGGDWKLALTAQRHAFAELPAVIIDRCDLTTSLSTGGTLRHHGALTVRANGRQFFDIPLPGGARILSLLVNGAPQKPAASGTAALRAQLPPGDAAVAVALTWEVQGAAWTGSGSRTIEPLRFTDDIPVVQSTWTLRLPEGFVYSDFAGDLERVNGPVAPELVLFPRLRSVAAESGFVSGGGGAEVKMQILQSSSPDVFGFTNADYRNTMSGHWLETQMKLITAPETLLRVVKSLELGKSWDMEPADAAERLASMIEVEQERGTEIVTIRVRSGDENESANCARTITAAYEERRNEAEQERLKRLAQTVDSEINKQLAAVEKARLEMNDLQKKHSIVDRMPFSVGELSTVIQPSMNTADQARSYYNELETGVMQMETQLKSLTGLKGDQLIAGAMELGIQNSTIQSLYPEYQQLVASEQSSLKSGFAVDHPKMKELRQAIETKRKQLLEMAEIFRSNLENKAVEGKKLLEQAKARAEGKETESVTERQNQSDYATAKHRYESSVALLSTMREMAARQDADESVLKKPVQILSVPPVNATAAASKSVAGLLPLEIALPDAGAAFQFRGYHAPGPITFTARSLRAESRIAWLWIAAGVVAAACLARRRTLWRGLLATLLLWLGPWVAGAGWGVCHRLLIGWMMGCALLLCRHLLRRCSARSVPLAAPVTVLFAVLLTAPQNVSAEEAAPGPDAAPRILVPYDPDKPLPAQSPQQLYLDYAAFQKLWQQARDNRLARNSAPASAPAGTGAAIVSALYEVTLTRGVLKVEAVLTIHSGKEWAALNLRTDEKSAPFAGAGIAALTLDDKPAVLHGGLLLMEKPGRHVLRASLQTALQADWRTQSLLLPPSPATLVSVSHADPSLRLRVNGGLPLAVEEKHEPAFTWRGTAATGVATSLKIERLPAVTLAAAAEKPALGAVRARLFATRALERVDSRIDFAFAGAERIGFSFAFDAELTPVQMDIPNLESWALHEADARRVLDFKLSVPARDGFTIGFTAERPANHAPVAAHQAPLIVPAANRTEFTLELLSSDDLELRASAGGGWAQSELQGMGAAEETGFRKAGTWKRAGAWSPLTWTSSARAALRSAQADYAWKIAGGMIETTVTFTLRPAEHEDLSSLSITLPTGAALQSLDGQRLADWWRDGDTLELRFTGATAETTMFFLDFTQPLTDAHWQNGVPLPALMIPGYDSMTVRAVVASGPETSVRLQLGDPTAREVEPEQARGDYRFLPPLQMQRGFTFEGAAFRATALLERVQPRFAVRWVLGAAVQDTWTETQFRADVEVKQGALAEVTFTMPAGTPPARVTGESVRESVRSALADGRSEYRVIFQSPVTTATALTIALELPHKETIALPDVMFPAAEMTERFLIMQNLSGGEMVPDAVASSGVEPLSRDGMAELHFTVQGFTNPLAWRLRDNWKFVTAHGALETTSGPQAVVLWAELTTMLRVNGPEWLRAVYHLQNRALQFLPLRLPDGMQLVSVTVAGIAVRADAGTLSDGKPGLLIPLIQTRPGDLAMDVEIVCRSAGGRAARRLEDPDIPGVSIQRTLWNVWTPPGWELSDADGNMERVEEQKSFMDKLEGEFSELDSLLSLSSMSKRGKERDYAWSQSSAKIEELESKLKAKEADYSGYRADEKLSQEFSQARERLTAARNIQQAKSAVPADDGRETTANFANSDKWVWDYNSSYLQKRGQVLEGEKDRAFSLLDSSAVLNGGVTSGNIALQSLRKPADEGKSEMKTRAYQQQIAVLNDAPQHQAQSGKDVTRSKPEDDLKQATQGSFNFVRGAQPQRRVVTPPTSEPADVQMVTGPGSPMVPRVKLEASAPDTTPAEPVAPPTPPPMLKPAGRVSIPVTFPLDGTVHRFRKVNDGASLHVTMKPVSRNRSSRWLAAGLLATGLGMLWLANRAAKRRGQPNGPERRSALAVAPAARQSAV